MPKLSILFGALLIFCACEKEGSSGDERTNIMFVNTRADATSTDVYNSTIFVQGDLAFGEGTGYLSFAANTYNTQFTVTGTNSVLASLTADYETDKNYSAFLIQNGSTNSVVITRDQFPEPPNDSCYVRFLHFSPDAGGVDVAVTDGDILFPTRFFNDQESNAAKAAFTLLKAGTYNLEVRPIGSSVPLLLLPNTVLQGGRVYTIYARGLVAEEGQLQLGAGIINNY
jgi:hypothetical protein